ncbi:MAG: hypothetical protein RI952_800 [Bacteroidota bacterium]|jgi:hypothetical protein
MKNLAKNILFFTLATLSHSAFAQKNVSEQVNVVRSYKPILAEALRINTNPEIKTDLVQIEPLNYQKIIFGLDSLTKTSPVEAEKMKSESITKIYPAYLRLAGGNFSNSLADLYISNLRAKDYQTGLAYNHRAASNSKVANMNNSTNDLSAWAKKMNTSNTLSAAFNYNRGVSNYYGYNHDSLTFSKDTTRQQYDIISLQTSLVSNIDNTSKLKYDVFFNAYSLNDAWTAKENRMITGGNFSYDVYDFKIGVDASQSEKNAITSKNNLMEFSPNVSLKEGEGTLTIGLISFIESGDNSSFHAYPNVKYTYEWKAASLVAFAGMNGKMHKNSLYQFAQENPFIGSVNILNTNEKLTFYAGARGSIGTKTAYLLNANLSQTENDAYFVVDQSDLRKYTIIYDGKNASAFHLSAEMTHQSNSKLRLFGKLNIHSYQTDTLREAYHRPTYEINAGATYAIADKFRLQLDMIAYSSMKAPDYRLGTINNIDGGTDLNLAIDYKYSKIISVFTQFNNILNYERARYLYYNNYGFQAMLGLSFNF